MIVYNHRMLEGSPIQYYQPSPSIPIPQSSKFSYFNRFQNLSSSPTYEDFMMPHSPNGSQSDSENSVSSLDVYPREIKINQIPVETQKIEDVQCKWISCGIVFESLDQLSAHVSQVHASSGPGGLFYCGWEGCQRNNKGFNARYKMLVHVRTHTNEKPHKCFQCDKAFSRAENLKIHSRSHSGEKPYICPVPGCQKAYSNSSDRFKHTRTHQVDKPYQCKVLGCPKRYTDPSSLRKHVKTYKHYVTDDTKNNKMVVTENLRNIRKDTVDSTSPKSDSSIITSDNCTCTHTCCINKSSNLIKLDAFINLSNQDIRPWNKFLDPFGSEPKIFKPYELMDEEMNIDLPLDLSMSHCST